MAMDSEKRSVPWFPMFVDLSEKRVLVIGGGNVALRKTRTLMRFCTRIRVVAPEILPAFYELNKNGQESGREENLFCSLSFEKRGFRETDLADIDLAVIATDDISLNAGAAQMCAERGIIRNVASDRRLCDFYFPAVAEQDGVIIGIGSGGDPARSRAMREKIQSWIAFSSGNDSVMDYGEK